LVGLDVVENSKSASHDRLVVTAGSVGKPNARRKIVQVFDDVAGSAYSFH
jgi:hypothetical protein